jgi:anti-sigma-K factor RskA
MHSSPPFGEGAMNTDAKRFELLVAGYLAGDLSPAERTELLRFLESDTELRARFFAEIETHELLKIVSRDEAEAATAPVSLSATRKTPVKVRRPSSKRVARRAVSRSHSWIPIAVAACLAIAAVLYFVNTPKKTAVIAKITRIQASGSEAAPVVVRGRTTEAATASADLFDGDRLETRGAGLQIQFVDGTSIDLKSAVTIKLDIQDGAKRVHLNQGELSAVVAEQPEGKAMLFVTPFGEAQVLGTELSLAIDKWSARLEVTKGKVRLTNPEKKFVDVAAGQFAVAAAGLELGVKPIAGEAPQTSRPGEVAVKFDFEDGLVPEFLKDGNVVVGPPRAGNKFSVSGIAKPDRHAFKKEVWFEKRHTPLFTYRDGMELSFDCWVSGSEEVTLCIWNSMQEATKNVVSPPIKQRQWTRVTLKIDQFQDDAKSAASKPGDIIMNLAIAAFSSQENALYVDNLEITQR